MPLTLSSRHNPLLKAVRHAVSAGRPTNDGLIAAEGPHLLQEALSSPWSVARILATPLAFQRFEHLIRKSAAETIEVSAAAFDSIASTEHTQGIITMLGPHSWTISDLHGQAHPLLVFLDGIQDPGNAGAIVRSAEAFGATGVLFGRGSVRIANPKFLRAAAGSIFRMPFLEDSELQAAAGLPVYALSPEAPLSIAEVDLRPGCVLVTGSEGAGISPSIRNASIAVRVPAIQVESLNAAVACSIALYEASRQRRPANK